MIKTQCHIFVSDDFSTRDLYLPKDVFNLLVEKLESNQLTFTLRLSSETPRKELSRK